MSKLIPIERVENKILLIRNQKVILDRDLAEMYGVTVSQLNQAVARNLDRFPDDFSFQLSNSEFENLKSQIVTSSWGGVRKLPRVFTEQGVAMLSSVLRSKRAVQVNIQIMRAFVKLRELLSSHHELALKLEEMEKRYDKKFAIVFAAIRELMDKTIVPPLQLPPKKKFGFQSGKDAEEGKIKARKK